MNIYTALPIETNLPYVSRRESRTKISVNIEIRVSVDSPESAS